MKKTILVIMLCMATALLIGRSALAEEKHHGHAEGKSEFNGSMCGKMFHQNFFSPEKIMRHQQELDLTAEQKTYMKGELQEAESTFVSLEWDLQDAISNLETMAQQQPVDEKQILAQLDKVMELENKIKRARLTLVIRLKNKLTPEQQTTLRETKGKHHDTQKKHGCLEKWKCPIQERAMEKGTCPMAREQAQPAS